MPTCGNRGAGMAAHLSKTIARILGNFFALLGVAVCQGNCPQLLSAGGRSPIHRIGAHLPHRSSSKGILFSVHFEICLASSPSFSLFQCQKHAVLRCFRRIILHFLFLCLLCTCTRLCVVPLRQIVCRVGKPPQASVSPPRSTAPRCGGYSKP